jgi:(2R)-ethylmalonyl-CoA mutase
MKERLVESNARRLAAIESGEQVAVGVNKWTESAPSPLLAAEDAGFLAVDPAAEREQVERLAAWRAARDGAAAEAAHAPLRRAAAEGRHVMPDTIASAKSGVTPRAWGAALREVWGEYRAPTGIAGALAAMPGRAEAVRARVEALARRLGRRPKLLVGKPGLDGHSNGAEQIALAARDAGLEVVYEGIRLTPRQIATAALQESVHVVGLSILSGSHVELAREVLARMREAGLDDIPVVVGGIIPPRDAEVLRGAGVARVYTPKDYELGAIVGDILDLVAARA